VRFVTFDQAAERLRGKTVAIVGSAPSVLDNAPGLVDSHEIVVRVNNYKLGVAQGARCDIHYSFYGNSVRKTREELERDGVQLCMCKCPDAKPIASEWHERNYKQSGIDFRYVYSMRGGSRFWFCDTFVPTVEHFLRSFELLEQHIPTTGFAAILDVLACGPKSVYLTGFDFFASGKHNVDEAWRAGDPADPIGHRPDLERAWLMRAWNDLDGAHHPILFDEKLHELLDGVPA
jgi:hypothetical protein